MIEPVTQVVEELPPPPEMPVIEATMDPSQEVTPPKEPLAIVSDAAETISIAMVEPAQ